MDFSLQVQDHDHMSEDEFVKEVQRNLSELIARSCDNTLEDHEKICNKILKCYKDNFEFRKGPPNLFDEIMEDILEDNWETLLEIAYLDFYHGQGMSFGYYDCLDFEEEGVYEKEDSDYINELAQMWEEDYVREYNEDLSDYIIEILDEYKLSYEVDSLEINNYFKSSDYLLYFNDCQNLLIPEWNIIMFASAYTGNYKYTNYTDIYNDDNFKLLASTIVSHKREG
jgi:hypothetical protein